MVSKAADKKTSPYVALDIDRLRIGVTLQAPIYDAEAEKNILLLARGKKITKAYIESLKKRGIHSVRVHERDLSNLMLAPGESQQSEPGSARKLNRRLNQLRATTSRRKQSEPETRSSGSPWQIQTSSFLHQVSPVQTSDYSPALQSKYHKQFEVMTKATSEIYRQLLITTTISMSQIDNMTSVSLAQLSDDLDLFVLEGTAPVEQGNLCRHSLQMSSLAMAMGTQLGLNRDALALLSLGCLLHDVGMTKINFQSAVSHEPVSPIERLELQKHPILTYDLLNQMHEIPMISRMVAYQIHERCDGSGYPRGQQGNQIHPLAKIAAVADEYINLVSDHGQTSGLLPYQAAEKLIFDAAHGKHDVQAVRALLQSISLYPVGSLVELNNGQQAQVIRTNRQYYDTPIVKLLDQEYEEEVVNLLVHDQLRVVRALSQAELQSAFTQAQEIGV
ncbi:HD-GYP domain-containing protein [Gimesia panareensis]|uniref:HD-GYP domain-containing protein n=1 Tax=Gimesia panareensis TaxID=2527978 RepID=UPI001188A93D|nr:HD domain-containing phosphohydrolase [Gimesia panareensis]QDU48699.1 Cyclic di-GMP phosphodiesterase response regulator RpfG [Gimesia panareensis]